MRVLPHPHSQATLRATQATLSSNKRHKANSEECEGTPLRSVSRARVSCFGHSNWRFLNNNPLVLNGPRGTNSEPKEETPAPPNVSNLKQEPGLGKCYGTQRWRGLAR